jgi:hypothetical protein
MDLKKKKKKTYFGTYVLFRLFGLYKFKKVLCRFTDDGVMGFFYYPEVHDNGVKKKIANQDLSCGNVSCWECLITTKY